MGQRTRTAVRRLLEAVDDGRLAALCSREQVELLVMFGSAVKEPDSAHDIDLAVRYADDSDPLGLLQSLYELTGYEQFDLLDLGRAGALARDRALSGGRLLVQAREGLFANAQIAAMMERMETAAFRRLELELLGR